MNLIELLKAFGVGVLIGAIFTLLKLPIPSPQVFAGVMSIIGVFAGYIIVQYFNK